MSPRALQTQFLRKSVHDILQELLFSVPWLFPSGNDYEKWRQTLVASSGLQDVTLNLVGSAATGYSFAPQKFGRPFSSTPTSFRKASDLDIAITSSTLFLQCWDAIVEADRKYALRLDVDDRAKLRQDVYYGSIDPDIAPRSSGAFRTVLSVRSAAGTHRLSSGFRTNLRVYRRESDLIGYQASSIRRVKAELNRQLEDNES